MIESYRIFSATSNYPLSVSLSGRYPSSEKIIGGIMTILSSNSNHAGHFLIHKNLQQNNKNAGMTHRPSHTKNINNQSFKKEDLLSQENKGKFDSSVEVIE